MKRVGGGESYSPRSSGLLDGGGFRQYRRRKSAIKGWGKNFSDRHMSDLVRIRTEVPDFDPALEFDYTGRELLLLAEKILVCDPKPPDEEPAWLHAGMLLYRARHEIYVESGTPLPEIVSGSYWRTHPQGRPFASEEIRRTTGCSFYDGVQATDREIVPPPSPRPAGPAKTGGECPFPSCGRPIASKGLCQSHYWQQHQGEELRPIGVRKRLPERYRDELRESWDNGESHAEMALRYGVNTKYAWKLRQEGRYGISRGRA